MMLDCGRTVADLLFACGVADALAPGAVVVDMGSIQPGEAQDHARRLAARGIDHLDAPVSGGTAGAEAGTLAIMAGGREEVFARVAPVLGVLGRPTLVGPSGSGQLAKLANQMIVATTIGAVAEGLLLAARGGADPARVRDALRGGFAESRILDLHGARMVAGDFTARGRATLQLKDLRNALSAAGLIGFDPLLTRKVAELFEDLVRHEGDLDHSALYLALDRLSQGQLSKDRLSKGGVPAIES
jgi:2-hydroxy-3-oxopropionate reductase